MKCFVRQALFLATGLLLGIACPAAAATPPDEKQHCPASTPGNTIIFFAPGRNSNDDKAQLDSLAGTLLKQQQPVCILAFVDPKEVGYSKKLAIRRILWVRDGLIAKGVPSTLIAAELRPAAPDQAKDSLRLVNVILGP